jgi:tetratricopeptide (TPR) repeat protein
VLVWSALAGGAHRGWPLAVALILVVVGAGASCLGAVRAGEMAWRRTALDAPLLLCGALVILQLLVSNRRLVAWALGPPAAPEAFPAPPVLVGTVAPSQTLASLVLFLAYAAVYYLVVHHVRRRRDLGQLVGVLVVTGAVLAFAGLIDYLLRESWIFAWREEPLRGRLTASFVNPDHFATWLAMLVCLGAGVFMAERQHGRLGLRDVLESRELREEALRRVLPFIGVGVMVLALVFTLSRGGIVGVLAALIALVALLRARNRVRSSLTVVAVLVAVALAYSAWIGLAPLLARVGTSSAGLGHRLTQFRASMPMVADFPLLGVGLGAYKAIYPRYQPLAHQPGTVYYPYAHNDLLQFVIETGVIGVGILVWAAWRLGRDLVGAHGFGRGACPVGAGQGEGARRHDPYGVPIATSALAGVVAVLVHASVDFPLRIPANGFLAAALLGIATVTFHTRFGTRGGALLSARRQVALPSGRVRVVAVGLVLVASTVVAGYAVRGALLDARFAAYRAAPSPARAEAIVAIDSHDPRGLAARAVARLDEGVGVAWRADAGGRPIALLSGAIDDLRQALRALPTEPTYHERLASAHAARALLTHGAEDVVAAAAHYRRAIAAAPGNVWLSVAFVRFALSHRSTMLDAALEMARAAIERDPATLGLLVDEMGAVRLDDERWLAAVPGSAALRLRLALELESRALLRPATTVARAALEVPTSREERGAARWLLARLLVLQGDTDGALQEISPALVRDAANPELSLAHADVLRARGDPRALDAYRAAVDAVPAVLRRSVDGTIDPFPVADPHLRSLIRARTGRSPLRYRKALAWYLGVRGLREQAVREWSAIVAADDRDALARIGLADDLEAVGQPDRALEEYRRAVALDGRSEFRHRLAGRLWASHQYFQAIAEWRTIRDREPRSVEARLALARALLKVGDRDGAVSEYQRALALDAANRVVAAELEEARRLRR